MKNEIKHISFRIEGELLKKFSYIAKSEDRSLNGMLQRLVRQCVADFERENGAIPEEYLSD